LVQQAKFKIQRSKGRSGSIVESSVVRAALLVLLQHDIVTFDTSEAGITTYTVHPTKARRLLRYGKYVEYVRRVLDETAASVVETLLVEGKLPTVPLVQRSLRQDLPKSDRYTHRQSVVEALKLLVEGHFVIPVPPHPSAKAAEETTTHTSAFEDPAIGSILSHAPYKTILPTNTVWKCNMGLIQDSLQAFCMGRLVAERHNHKVPSCGSMVTAALRFQSYSGVSEFAPKHIVPFLPKPVQQALERKPGGLLRNLSTSLVDLSRLDVPSVLQEVEEAHGHDEGGKFVVNRRSMVSYLQDRTVHQFLIDAHGEAAARLVSILREKGACEDHALADAAMVPAKDLRQCLHTLYRQGLVQLMTLGGTNPASMIFLWSVSESQLIQSVRDKVCRALLNLRLRRQSEMIGKGWMERVGDDENEQLADTADYQKLCLGLERLDHALLQLDDTIMVLFDF
jgi:DNA-directed RNA polymerase III subunit RPC3